MSLRIASLFSGTSALDLAVQAVFGGEIVWHSQYEPPDKKGREDKNQYAARILARHWPAVPNLGDITKICWLCVLEEHGPVGILTGGFPCTDVSTAGKRAGLTPDTRSGLWTHMARAIHVLQPRLVIIENVEGLLSSKADRGLEPGAEALDESAGAGGLLRALGAVLGDLATLGFHAEWARVAASEVGAPHGRKRVFIYAWPADADPADLGHERGGDARRRGHGFADGGVAAAHTCGKGLEVGRVEPDRHELPATERGRREPAPHPDGVEPERRGVAAVLGSQAATEPREGDQRERAGDAAGDSGEVASHTDGRGCERDTKRDSRQDESGVGASQRLDAVGRGVQRATPADTAGVGRGEGRPESARQQGGPDASLGGSPALADADDFGRRADVLNLRPGQPDLDWGDYGPAIRRWERILGRRAPWPTDALGRLSPVFTEWLMGLPDGWVTNTAGLTRAAMLRALGNGVVPRQAVAAIRLLHQRAIEDAVEAAA